MLQKAAKAVIDTASARTSAGGALRAPADELDRCFERLSMYPRYSTCCLFMAHVAAAALRARGLRAQARLCTMRVGERGTRVYALGQVGFADPGQLVAHAVCIVADRLLLDYGTGVACRDLDGRFPRYLAAELHDDGDPEQIAAVRTDTGALVRWMNTGYSIEGVAQAVRAQSAMVRAATQLVLGASRLERELYDRLPLPA